MARYELRVGGFGGQGVILTGYILGKAAAVNEDRHATMNQSYGPEARGSACSSSVVISDEPVTYPYTRGLDVLLVMNHESYRVFKPEVKETGTILVDDSLVTPDPADKRRTLGVPAARIAESLGKRVVTNMVMLGFLAGPTDVVSGDALREAIRAAVPTGTEDLNLKAFDAGREHGGKVTGAEPQEVSA